MSLAGFLQYSDELKQGIQIAQSIAKEYSNPFYGSAHLLKGILHDDIGLSSALAAMGKNIHYIRDWADIRIKRFERSAKKSDQPNGNDNVVKLLEVADIIRLKLGLDRVTPFCVLVAMCRPNVAFTPDQLKSLPLSEDELLKAELQAIEQSTTSSKSQKKNTAFGGKAKKQDALSKYCINKTAIAKDGGIDPIIGRDREVREICKILGRRKKPNVIIIGEPGVGKTALVEGFAQQIVDEHVPTNLIHAALFELDMGALIAGASYKGEIEDRIKSVIREIKNFEGKIILFIDEIHVLLDSKGGAGGVANLLKPELARGGLTVIGATTLEEYRKFFDKDKAFKRRFEILEVEEPNEDKALRMLKALLTKYEEHHEIEAEEEALRTSVTLAKRYIKERRLPDVAIDLMDRTMASAKMMKDTTKKELDALDQELKRIEKDFAKKTKEAYHAELLWFDTQIRERISPILIGKINDLKEAHEIHDVDELQSYINSILETLQSFDVQDKKVINAVDIAAVVSFSTGIPVGKIQTDEREKLQRMSEQLKKRVIGQDHAIESITNAITVSRAGLADKKRPAGKFFFLGSTGTGKTELAKALAEFLFNDESAMIRFDMSEFTKDTATQFLLGADPGYIGYENGGALVNAIRQQPYSIVLFDEIEKAHPEVFKVFLQMLDDGKLTDKLKKEGDFTNAIILFTSNIGSEYIVSKFNEGKIPGQRELTTAMSQYFKDEFLGRLDEIIPFAPITEQTVVKIFEIQLKSLRKALSDKDITIQFTEEALQHLAMIGFSPRFGARPLRRVIMTELQNPLAKMIITGELKEGEQVKVSLEEGEKISWKISP